MAGETDSNPTSGHASLIPAGDWPIEQARFLNRACLLDAPRESCGLILGQRDADHIRVHSLSHCENSSEEPLNSFRIPAGHLMDWDRQAAAQNLQIVGAWHSHPNGSGKPSHSDLQELPEGWLGLIVVHSPNGSPRLEPYGRGGPAPAFVHA